MTLLGALAVGLLALLVGRRLCWLTLSGQAAAAAVGLAVLLGCGPSGLGLLLAFFVTASALGHFRADVKPVAAESGGRRGRQVLANGGLAAALCLLALVGGPQAAHTAFVGAVAAATADTWATEIGSAGSWPAWSPVGGGQVAAGTSGAVSFPGTAAGIAGAAVIGLLASSIDGPALQAIGPGRAWTAPAFGEPAVGWVRLAAYAGTAGMLADSLLGATLEKRVAWIGNEEVNLGCTLVGAAVAWWLAPGS